jgi:hypothetical protein
VKRVSIRPAYLHDRTLRLGPLRIEAFRFDRGRVVVANWRRWRHLGGLVLSGWRLGRLPREEGEELLPGPNGIP